MNRHFERKECFWAASCKVLCKILTEAKVWFSLSDTYRIVASMPMFATYRVKVEIIISEVLMAFLWESRAWKVQVQEHFPNFLLVIEINFCLVIPVQTPCHERDNSCLNRIICDLRSTLGVWVLWKHTCAFLLMVLFLWSIITDWQDENKRTKKWGSQARENLCSLYSKKCLASEKFVLAGGSNLSLATGLAGWKVSLEPWRCFIKR